jgi:23S rRNA pseudouridine1911/1915/1917 synthase
MVTILSSAGESIAGNCHVVVEMAMNDTEDEQRWGGEELATHVGERVDVALAVLLGRSRSRVQMLLKAGAVRLEAAAAPIEASYKLRLADVLVVRPGNPGRDDDDTESPRGEAIALDILYEDDALLALNKQPRLVVHPAAGHRTGTLVNALVHHLGVQSVTRGGAGRAGLVHRLDKDTSGVILIAKSDAAHEKLAAAFAGREVRKFYRALCWGTFRRQTGSLRESIGRHRVHRQKMTVLKTGGRAAHTDYRVLTQGTAGAEVECELHTGRTHQIRVHLAHLSHPVWGDAVYGRLHPLADGFEPKRQMLHAARIEIAHPLTGKPLRVEAPLPADYVESRKRLLA